LKLKESNRSKKDLQELQNVFGIEFKLQLSNTYNQIDTYSSKNSSIYEETMMFCLSSILDSKYFKDKDLVFIDIGSYIGYYASFVSQKLSNKADVYAIESNKLYCENILEAKKINGFDNLTVAHHVLSNRKESLLVYEDSVVEKAFLLKNMNKSYDHHEIDEAKKMLVSGIEKESITFDDFCIRYSISPNIIKIDVHGSEGKVFGGAKEALKSGLEIILLELHPQQLLDQFSEGMTKNSILNQLHNYGFNTYLISPFRFNHKTHEYHYYKENNKLLYLQLTSENQESILFDRNLVDIFILCIKKDINIKDLNCF
jgi:FkbM family methyltransferase